MMFTLLRDSAHEWYTAYEKRNRQIPRDWMQLSTALLEKIWIKYPVSGGAEPIDVHLSGDTTCEGVCLTV